MMWLTWRQFRTQSFVIAGLLAALAAYLLITGTQLRNSYSSDLAFCRPQNSCFGTFNALQDQYNGPMYLAEFLVMAAPALIGIFLGAPLVAGELERGTHYMVWNQSVTRVRWLAVKLAGIALVAVIIAGVLSLLITWWASPLDAVAGNRWGTRAFNARDVAPLGYAVFAFAVGVTAGLLIRRTLPAMAATLAIFIVVQVVVTTGLRPNLLPTATSTVAINQSTMSQAMRFDRSSEVTGPVNIDLPVPAGAWAQSQTPALNSAGQPIQTGEILNCWTQLVNQGVSPAGKGGGPGFGSLGACLAPLNLHVDLTYQPASRYWPLQWFETAIYAVLAALLFAVCFSRIRRLRS